MKARILLGFVQVGSFAMASRILGFLRDLLFASIEGASAVTDVFFVAFQLPNTFRAIFAEGAMQSASVPTLKQNLEAHDKRHAREVLGGMFLLLTAILVLLVLFGEIWMPGIMRLLASGYGDRADLMHLAVGYGRLVFPYIMLISLVALGVAALNLFKHFIWSGTTLLFFNILFIAALLIAHLENPAMGLHIVALAITLSGLVQFLWVLWGLHHYGFLPAWPRRWHWLPHFANLFFPNLLAALMAQTVIYAGTVLATHAMERGVSYLYYATRLFLFPTGITAFAIFSVLLPSIGGRGRGDHKTFLESIALTLQLAFPMAIGMGTLAPDITSALFGHGRLQAQELAQVAELLQLMVFGIPAVLIARNFSSLLIANHRSWRNFLGSFCQLCAYFLGIAVLYPALGLRGIVLSSVISYFALLGMEILLSRSLWRWEATLWRIFFFGLGAAMAMGLILLLLHGTLTTLGMAVIPRLGVEILVGIVIYIGLLSITFGKQRRFGIAKFLKRGGNSKG